MLEYTFCQLIQNVYCPILIFPWQIGWLDGTGKTGELTVSSSNYDRDGFIIYCSDKKLFCDENYFNFWSNGTLCAYISLHFHGLGYKL